MREQVHSLVERVVEKRDCCAEQEDRTEAERGSTFIACAEARQPEEMAQGAGLRVAAWVIAAQQQNGKTQT